MSKRNLNEVLEFISRWGDSRFSLLLIENNTLKNKLQLLKQQEQEARRNNDTEEIQRIKDLILATEIELEDHERKEDEDKLSRAYAETAGKYPKEEKPEPEPESEPATGSGGGFRKFIRRVGSGVRTAGRILGKTATAAAAAGDLGNAIAGATGPGGTNYAEKALGIAALFRRRRQIGKCIGGVIIDGECYTRKEIEAMVPDRGGNNQSSKPPEKSPPKT